MLLTVVACEKPIIPSENESTPKGNVILHFSPYLQSNFTRSTANVAYTKVNLMLFNKGTSTRAFDHNAFMHVEQIIEELLNKK